jgi:hypothetical protein
MATLLTAWEMMEGENVKASTTIFQTTTTQGSAFCPILHRVLVPPKLSFDDFIRHQFQALTFASFC